MGLLRGNRDHVENPVDNRPHDLVIVDAGESPRAIAIHITAERTDSKRKDTGLDASHEVPDAKEPRDEPPWEREIYIEFLDPATYTIDLQIPTEDTGEQITIRQEDFTCSWHTHRMIVRAAGRIEVGGNATTMDCGTSE